MEAICASSAVSEQAVRLGVVEHGPEEAERDLALGGLGGGGRREECEGEQDCEKYWAATHGEGS